MAVTASPPAALLAGRRALEGLPGVALLADWTWYPAVNRWVLRVALTPDNLGSSVPVPATTVWYILVDSHYPYGNIDFYPAKESGLEGTFPHQLYNSPGDPSVPWRSGKLCLHNPGRALGRAGLDGEPFDVHRRLKWHVCRALEWVSCASRDELLRVGDPFELPHFPRSANSQQLVVFSEGPDTLANWQQIPNRVGLVDLVPLRRDPPILVATCFRALDGTPLVVTPWGEAVSARTDAAIRGLWLRLAELPRIPPWQAPATWGQLRAACRLQGIVLDEHLRRCTPKIRNGQRHLALIGFPIPQIIGGPPSEMHWQALELPALTPSGAKVPGFRQTETGYWQHDRTWILHDQARLNWVASENWHAARLGGRGRLPDGALTGRVALIGAGALGSAVAELLVRAGLSSAVVVDGEHLGSGNLVRHTLGIEHVGSSKAKSLASRLNHVSPHAKIEYVDSSFPPETERERDLLNTCNVVLDCTGRDDVLGHLENFPWQGARLFISLSLSYRARRLFCFVAYGDRFPRTAFTEATTPWLEQQRLEDNEYPWEGAGCWHPVFPARIDDVWLMAGVAVRAIEPYLVSPPTEPRLLVFQQPADESDFSGVRRVEPPDAPH